MVKISIWSDYSCPFCFIVEKRIENMLKELGIEEKVEYDIHSFELYPDAPLTAEETTLDRFAKKYGLTLEEAMLRIEAISELGEKEGLDFKYATTKNTNTMDAHRLTQYVKKLRDSKLTKRVSNLIFEAYFTYNLELANHEVLYDIARKAGLNLQEVEEVLSTKKFEDIVREDEKIASLYNITAVPFLIINGKGVMGAQSKEFFRDLILNELKEESKVEKNNICGIDGCEI